MTRRWKDDPPQLAPQPVIVVSSRHRAPVPPEAAGATRFAELAKTHGWAVRVAYSLADVPARPRKTAHRLAIASVRFGRGDRRASGWATWYREDGGPWRFHSGWLQWKRYGLRELRARIQSSEATE